MIFMVYEPSRTMEKHEFRLVRPFGNTAWAIAQHPMEELWPSLGITHEIVMGNNDVHYVWLTRDDMPP